MGKKSSLWLGIAGGLLLAASAAAEQTNYKIGEIGGSELKIGLGPRAVAMGEAFVGLADDLNSTAWNAAGLAQVKGYQAGFMHDVYMLDTQLEYVAYAQGLGSTSGIGANVMMLNFGSIEKVGEVDGMPDFTGQSFTPIVMTAAVGYGQWIMPVLAVGGAVKFINQNIDNQTATAAAVDVGGLVKPGLEGLQLGLAVQNLGTSLASAQLPMNAKAGAAYLVPLKISEKDAWNVLLDVNVPFGDTKYTSANIGTEYWVYSLIALRAGYKVKDTGDLGGITGLTAGLGAKLPISESININVDYAMLSFGDLGLTHQIALGVQLK